MVFQYSRHGLYINLIQANVLGVYGDMVGEQGVKGYTSPFAQVFFGIA